MKEWREIESVREKSIDKFGYPNGFYVYAVSVKRERDRERIERCVCV